MPKRVIDFDAMWGSDKLAACAEWAQAEYAWLYGLADASGCFELTNLRVIWGRVAAIRRNLTIERLEQIFGEFQHKGLLFVWEHEGKRYGHWTGSDVPGRLPPPSWRMRLEKLAPPVPKQQFAQYVSRFARGRAALAGGGFGAVPTRAEFESSNLKSESWGSPARQVRGDAAGETQFQEMDRPNPKSSSEAGQVIIRDGGGLSSLKDEVEAAHVQDWKLNLSLSREEVEKVSPTHVREVCGEKRVLQTKLPLPVISNLHSNSITPRRESFASSLVAGANRGACAGAAEGVPAAAVFQGRDKSFLLARELIVGQGPVCGPVKVKAEVLERIRARDAARSGSRSP
jgi:hypothetical protein